MVRRKLFFGIDGEVNWDLLKRLGANRPIGLDRKNVRACLKIRIEKEYGHRQVS